MTDTSRLANIDALRGIASLAVCWFHLTNGYSEESMVRASGQFGWLGVEAFFVISGFIIPYALFKGRYRMSDDWKTFIWKRVIRIEPPLCISRVVGPCTLVSLVSHSGLQRTKPKCIIPAGITSSWLSEWNIRVPVAESGLLDTCN